MKKNLTELGFILDRSGSMSGLEADTIGGFNAMIEKQKKAPGEAMISTILFDNVSEVIHDRVNVQDIRPMTDREYSVRGACACLLKDAADNNDNPNFVSHAEGEVRIIIIMSGVGRKDTGFFVARKERNVCKGSHSQIFLAFQFLRRISLHSKHAPKRMRNHLHYRVILW